LIVSEAPEASVAALTKAQNRAIRGATGVASGRGFGRVEHARVHARFLLAVDDD
jgi:hypothetical protein